MPGSGSRPRRMERRDRNRAEVIRQRLEQLAAQVHIHHFQRLQELEAAPTVWLSEFPFLANPCSNDKDYAYQVSWHPVIGAPGVPSAGSSSTTRQPCPRKPCTHLWWQWSCQLRPVGWGPSPCILLEVTWLQHGRLQTSGAPPHIAFTMALLTSSHGQAASQD